MKSIYSDEEIINGIRSKDNLIIDFIYQNYKEKVIKYVERNSGNKDEAEDVFQESILKLYKITMKKEFKLIKTFEVYFSTVYRNTWKHTTKYKNKYRLTEIDQEVFSVEDDATSYQEYENNQVKKIVWQQYKQLKSECREVLDMYYAQRKSMNEIAYQMNLKNEQNAKNKKYKCIESLKTLIMNQPSYKHMKFELK